MSVRINGTNYSRDGFRRITQAGPSGKVRLLGFVLVVLGGTAVLFAHARPGEASDFPLNPFFKGERRVVATYSGSLEEQNEVWKLITWLSASPSATTFVFASAMFLIPSSAA